MREPSASPLSPQERCNARRWLLLAVSAMALSALLAILLVLSRTPGVQELFGLKAAFHTVLVLHVNFAVLVWLLSFGGVLWSLALKRRAPLIDGLAYGLAVAGALLLLLSPWLGEVVPVMSNYIPVLDTPLFFTGLISFAGGVSLLAFGVVLQAAAPKTSALRLAALAWFAALTVFVLHALQLLDLRPLAYEQLFWGGGHLLQFVYLLLLFAVWQVRGGHAVVVSPRLTYGLLGVALLIALIFDPASEPSRTAFTRLMQFGTPLLLLPAMWTLVRDKSLRHDVTLAASLGLMGLGLLVGALINSDTVTVTAHYHATNAAITVAFMGAAYELLPRLGFFTPAQRVQQWQLRLYASGMALYVIGMATSGWLGVPRKSALVIDGGSAQLAMAVMGMGGLVSVVATLLFVGLMFAAMTRRSALLLNKSMGEVS
ncbi:MAG TPA: hypothetical protein VGE00_09340 [Gammaproteobacteria bacterium]